MSSNIRYRAMPRPFVPIDQKGIDVGDFTPEKKIFIDAAGGSCNSIFFLWEQFFDTLEEGWGYDVYINGSYVLDFRADSGGNLSNTISPGITASYNEDTGLWSCLYVGAPVSVGEVTIGIKPIADENGSFSTDKGIVTDDCDEEDFCLATEGVFNGLRGTITWGTSSNVQAGKSVRSGSCGNNYSTLIDLGTLHTIYTADLKNWTYGSPDLSPALVLFGRYSDASNNNAVDRQITTFNINEITSTGSCEPLNQDGLFSRDYHIPTVDPVGDTLVLSRIMWELQLGVTFACTGFTVPYAFTIV